MSKNNRKIAGFMSAESIYSLAFYIVMVAAIAGVGAGVLSKADSAKAASAISLLRANYIAECGTLGYSPIAGAAGVVRLSGGLIQLDAAGTAALLPGGGTVTMGLRSTTFPITGFTITITNINKPDVCNAVGGVGYGTWSAFLAQAKPGSLPAASKSINTASKPWTSKVATKTLCDAAATTAVTMLFASY